MTVRRLFVEKRQGFFDVPARQLAEDLIESFRLVGLRTVRLIRRYDIEGLSDEEYKAVRDVVFAEPPVDVVYEEKLPNFPNTRKFAIEYLPGQYDQRADSAAQCVQLVTQKERPIIRTATLVLLVGNISDAAFNGNGCAISQASADMMIDLIMGKPLEEAMRLQKSFMGMIQGTASEEEIEELEEAAALQDISHMPARVKCAVLGWRTMREMVEKLEGE